jgi:hypothetical protein
LPGTIPATSQDLLLSSTTAINVVAWSKAETDFLLWLICFDMEAKSVGWR